MDWIDLAQDRGRWQALLNAAINHRVPEHERQFLTSSGPIGFSRRTRLHTVSRLAKGYIICSAHLHNLQCSPTQSAVLTYIICSAHLHNLQCSPTHEQYGTPVHGGSINFKIAN